MRERVTSDTVCYYQSEKQRLSIKDRVRPCRTYPLQYALLPCFASYFGIPALSLQEFQNRQVIPK